MSLRISSRLAVLALALASAACNSAKAPEPPPATSLARTRSVTPADFKLPEGSGCSGAVARYRAIQDNDLAMGHVNQGVYDQIAREIAEAESACAAGQDGRAQSLIHASKSRHGYPG
jgi:hypothetical protein